MLNIDNNNERGRREEKREKKKRMKNYHKSRLIKKDKEYHKIIITCQKFQITSAILFYNFPTFYNIVPIKSKCIKYVKYVKYIK